MKGTQKQINWANDIKESKDFDKFLGKGRDEKSNQIVQNTVNFIKNIDSSQFWIDYRNKSEMDILNSLMTHGLRIEGLGENKLAKMDKEGNIEIIEKSLI